MSRLGATALVLACAACGSSRAPRTTAPSRTPADELVLAIETSDLPRAFSALCAAYAAGGTPCAETAYLTTLDAKDVMSRIDDEQNVKMSPMPAQGGGLAYWDNWSTILSSGSWKARGLFAGEDDARRTANMLLVTVLAHELGHHVAQIHRCHPWGPAKELRADELSVALLRGLLADARLAPLHARMRVVADAMIDAVPVAGRTLVPPDVDVRAWASAQPELPTSTPAYVTLHLSRQRRLLEEHEAYGWVARRLCLDPLATYVASRRIRPGQTRTVALLPNPDQDVVSIDRAGHVFATSTFVEKGRLRIRRLDAVAPVLEVDVPAEVEIVSSFAAFSGERFAIANDQHAWQIDRGVVQPRGEVADRSELAFDAKGRLLVAHRTATTWDVAAIGEPPAWSVRLENDDRSSWADGPLERAHGSPEKPAFRDGRVMFFDHERLAIRAVDAAEVVTLAGSIAGRRDGSSSEARFFAVAAVGALDDGRIAVVETDHAARRSILRVIEPR